MNAATKNQPLSEDVAKNKDIAAFAYTLVFAPILLVTRRDSAFIRHHALQAAYLGLIGVIFMLLPGKLSYANIVVAAAALMGFLEAQAGHLYKMPIVSDLIVRNITLQSAWQGLKNFFVHLFGIVSRMFQSGSKEAMRGTETGVKYSGENAVKVEKLEAEVNMLKRKIETLESLQK